MLIGKTAKAWVHGKYAQGAGQQTAALIIMLTFLHAVFPIHVLICSSTLFLRYRLALCVIRRFFWPFSALPINDPAETVTNRYKPSQKGIPVKRVAVVEDDEDAICEEVS